ncbi:glycosyltransferase family 2 protein [Lactovum odontotermitis]
MSDSLSTPRVGIFMPAYNYGSFIDEALESLKAQDFQDFFVHIVDDGSDDGITADKLSSINYEKGKVFLNSDNQGVAKRQRDHFELFKDYDFILVLCADDKLRKDFLSKSVNYLDDHPECGAVGCSIQRFGDDENLFTLNADKCKLPDMLVENSFNGSALMRTKALRSISLLTKRVRYQDWERWLGMLANGWVLGIIDEPLFFYRQHSRSLSRTATNAMELSIKEGLYDRFRDLYERYSKEVYLLSQKLLLESRLEGREVWEAKVWLDSQYTALIKEKENSQKVWKAKLLLEEENEMLIKENERLKKLE